MLPGECDTDGMEREKKKLPVDHRSLAPSVSLIPLRLALTLKHSPLSRNFLLFFHYSAWFEFLLISACFLFPPIRFFFCTRLWKIIPAISINTSRSKFHFDFASSAFCHTFSPSLRCRHQEWSFIFSSTAVLMLNPIGHFTSLLRHPVECLSPDCSTFSSIFWELSPKSLSRSINLRSDRFSNLIFHHLQHFSMKTTFRVTTRYVWSVREANNEWECEAREKSNAIAQLPVASLRVFESTPHARRGSPKWMEQPQMLRFYFQHSHRLILRRQ